MSLAGAFVAERGGSQMIGAGCAGAILSGCVFETPMAARNPLREGGTCKKHEIECAAGSESWGLGDRGLYGPTFPLSEDGREDG